MTMPLHLAAENGHTDTIRALLGYGATVDCKDDQSCTPLHLASCMGHVSAIRLLLERGANLCVRDASGRTVLHTAALAPQDNDLWDVLLEERFSSDETKSLITVADMKGSTPLHCTAALGNMIGLRRLLESVPSVPTFAPKMLTPLHVACMRHSSPAVNLLLESIPGLASATDGMGKLALHYACSQRRRDIVEALLWHGSPVNGQDAHGVSPLAYSAKNCRTGDGDCIIVLLEAGADPNTIDAYECTPLMDAVRCGNAVVVDTLVQGGAQIDPECGLRRNALYVAMQCQDSAIVSLLTSHGATVSGDEAS
ncbi:hypothetical protein DIPPA_54612 [Diplonema papillatum]|nr:hypothetical protein DIPPA_54612 [Diplonema papillatum]